VTSPTRRHDTDPVRFAREVAADHRFERRLVIKELAALLLVVALVVTRQLWLV
jgi:hypothetical protein